MINYFNCKLRVVSLENLKAMCEHISGMCHRYYIEKVTKRFVYVSYTHPDEYGVPHPLVAVYPIYRPDCENPSVVLDMVKVMYDDWQGEGWQYFEQLKDCPQLWRNPQTGKWEANLCVKQPDASSSNSASGVDSATGGA